MRHCLLKNLLWQNKDFQDSFADNHRVKHSRGRLHPRTRKNGAFGDPGGCATRSIQSFTCDHGDLSIWPILRFCGGRAQRLRGTTDTKDMVNRL